MTNEEKSPDSTPIVLTLFFLWVLLVLLLFYLYKRLNRDTNDQYTVQRLIYRQGGLRDRVMQGVDFMTTFIARFRPQNQDEEEAFGDNEEGHEEGEEQDEEDNEGNGQNETNAEENEGDSSDDYSSIDLKERVKKNNSTEEIDKKKEGEEQKEESKDEDKEDGHKPEEGVKEEERVGLLVNIKPFSGSAIWSEEKTEESNVTAL